MFKINTLEKMKAILELYFAANLKKVNRIMVTMDIEIGYGFVIKKFLLAGSKPPIQME